MGWNIGDFANAIKGGAGEMADNFGTGLRVSTGWSPNWGVSEWLAGNTTSGTGLVNERGLTTVTRNAAPVRPGVFVDGMGLNKNADSGDNSAPSQENIVSGDGGYYSGGRYYAGGSGGGGSVASSAAANLARYKQSMKTSQDGYRAAAGQNVLDTNNTYDNNSKTAISALKGTQDEINTSQANNALNLIRSMSTIANGVRTGLKSGGVQLADMGATDSGAADALARAYATMGNQQVNDANNEAQIAKGELDAKQLTFNREKDDKINGLNTWRDTELSRIRNDLHSKLTLLDASGQENGVTGGVDYGVVDQIVNDAVARLQGVDSMRNQRFAEIHGLSEAEINAKASDMNKAGVDTGTSPFLAGQEGINTSISQPGVATSQVPLFNTLNKKDDGSTTNTDVTLKKKITA